MDQENILGEDNDINIDDEIKSMLGILSELNYYRSGVFGYDCICTFLDEKDLSLAKRFGTRILFSDVIRYHYLYFPMFSLELNEVYYNAEDLARDLLVARLSGFKII